MSRWIVATLLFSTVVDGFRRKGRKQRWTQLAHPEVQEEAEKDDLRREDWDRLEPQLIVRPRDFPHCHLSNSSCDMKDMSGPTLVYTDNEQSKCYNGEAFAFLVHPGASDKLLFYMPSGGACWENPKIKLLGAAGVCFSNLWTGLSSTGYGNGVAAHGRADNIFRTYTLVSPPYCSGGAYVANTSFTHNGTTYYQHDWNNNEFARVWARKNLAPKLKSFVLMGSSAGSLGAAVWSDYMLSTFSYEKASVVLDSYMGVFPTGTQGPLIKSFGACTLPIMRNFRAQCEAGTANLQDILDYSIAKYPNVAFAHIQPKTDLVQRAFYSQVALSFLRVDLLKTPTQFYYDTNSMMQRYNKYPNYVAYIIQGSWHVFAPFPFWWAASTAGFMSPAPAGTPSLAAWATRFINHEPVQSQCRGTLKQNTILTLSTEYCDAALFPKTLVLRIK